MDVPVDNPPSLQHLRTQGCSVTILHVHKPHIIFVSKPGNANRNPKHICQIGLRGIFPTDEFGETCKSKHDMKWTDRSIASMVKFIDEAKELYFLSSHPNEKYELFAGICNSFGNLFLLNKFDKVEDLSTLLCNNKYAYFCINTFNEMLSAGYSYDKPSKDELQRMRDFLMPHISKQLEFDKELNFTPEMSRLEKLKACRRPKKSVGQPSSISSNENVDVSTKPKSKRKILRIRDIINENKAKKSENCAKTNIHSDEILNLNESSFENPEHKNDTQMNVMNENTDSSKFNKIVNQTNTNLYSDVVSAKEINEPKVDDYHLNSKKVLEDVLDNYSITSESMVKEMSTSLNSNIEEDPDLLTEDVEDELDDELSIFYHGKNSLATPALLPKNTITLNSFRMNQMLYKKKSETYSKYEDLSVAFEKFNENDLIIENVTKSMESVISNVSDKVDTGCVDDAKNLPNNVPVVDSKFNIQESCNILESINTDEKQIRNLPALLPGNDIENYMDDLSKPKLMIYFEKGKPPNFWLALKDAFFNKFILAKLKFMKIDTPMSSQKIVWPSVMRGHNTLLVGPPNSGKTLGFLAPLCHLIIDTNFKELPNSQGPLAWIVCPTSANAVALEKVCQRLLGNKPRISILRIDNFIEEDIIYSSLLRGCTVLISTPALVKFLKGRNPVLNLERLLYLMFCDTDVLNDKFYSEIEQIFLICTNHSKNRDNQSLTLQILADSRKWCDLMSILVHSVSNPLMVINAFQETLLCCKVDIKAVFVSSLNKPTELNDYLSRLDKQKIIIVCESDDEILKIESDIDNNKYQIIKVFNHVALDKYINIESLWKMERNVASQVILLTCDSGLMKLNITDAECLIHYFIPPLFVSFQRRFSTIIDNLTPTWIETDNNPTQVTIFITEDNQTQLPKMVNFLNRCGLEINEKLKGMSESLLYLKDIQKAESLISLCNELLSFGSCSDPWNCEFRHSIIPKYDTQEDWLPKSGYVNFEIISIHNACHYTVRLMSYIKMDGTKTVMKQTYLKLAIQMLLFFAKEENRVPVRTINPGDICAAEIKPNQFFRCKIIKIFPTETSMEQSKVSVFLIEQNKYFVCFINCIFELPKKFQDVHNPIVDIKLANIMPINKDVDWNLNDVTKIKTLFSELGTQTYLRGKIALSLNNTLWVDSLQCVQNLNICDQIAVQLDLKKYILEKNMGITNSNHLPSLYKICAKGSIELPNYELCKKVEKPKKVEEKLPDPQWAFIESDQFSAVYFSSGINPHKFYIRIAKWESCLINLEKDIAKHVTSITKYNDEELSIDVGHYYLARYSDGAFYRCRIDEINSIDDSSIEYKCFFVDYGDVTSVEKNDILPLSPQLITQLPFQAIECKLIGIKPLSDEWDQSAINFLSEYSFDSVEREKLKLLMAKKVYSETAELTGGQKSALYVFDPLSESHESFNDLFLSQNFAEIHSADAHYLNELSEDVEMYFIDVANNDESVIDIDSFEMPENLETHSRFVDFECDDDDSCSSDDGWDCTFTKEDLMLLQKENEMKIFEVPSNATTSNIDEYFDSNNVIENVPNDNTSVTNVSKTELIAKPIVELPSHRTPFVRWSQTKENVIIKIDLVGVKSYSMIINYASLTFECMHNDTQYKLDLDLFGCLDKELCSHSCLGLYINVKLVKAWKNNWPSLLKTTLKMHWLRYECDNENSDSEKEDEKKKKSDEQKELSDLLKKADEEVYSDEDDDGDGDISEFIAEFEN